MFICDNYIFLTFQYSNVLTRALIEMNKSGLDFSKLHLVAHSLGAQLSSLVARGIQRKTNQMIKRITGLDPALPLFYPGIIAGHLSAIDAKLVRKIIICNCTLII
jgi:hypothetical protein